MRKINIFHCHFFSLTWVKSSDIMVVTGAVCSILVHKQYVIDIYINKEKLLMKDNEFEIDLKIKSD